MNWRDRHIGFDQVLVLHFIGMLFLPRRLRAFGKME
jgi:hypothetical protein